MYKNVYIDFRGVLIPSENTFFLLTFKASSLASDKRLHSESCHVS